MPGLPRARCRSASSTAATPKSSTGAESGRRPTRRSKHKRKRRRRCSGRKHPSLPAVVISGEPLVSYDLPPPRGGEDLLSALSPQPQSLGSSFLLLLGSE